MITTILLTAAILLLATICRSNLKRINQLERDMTYLAAKKVTTEPHAETVQQSTQTTEEPPKNEVRTADAAHMLKEAGVTDRKAYRAADIAVRHGWQLLDIQENIKMVRYMRARGGDVQKVNIYHGGKGGKRDLFTVATAINHPTKGKTQLFRKYITDQELEAVMKNPRAHTDKGYYQGK